jgi:hypothetical protein
LTTRCVRRIGSIASGLLHGSIRKLCFLFPKSRTIRVSSSYEREKESESHPLRDVGTVDHNEIYAPKVWAPERATISSSLKPMR